MVVVPEGEMLLADVHQLVGMSVRLGLAVRADRWVEGLGAEPGPEVTAAGML